MNQDKIGKFIATLRKEQKLTQEELAEKLGVTDKSVSRWENGKNMPDVSLFESLCKELNISVNELLKGEKIENNKNYNYINCIIIVMVLCAIATMQILDLLFKLGYENIWKVSFKVGIIAWLSSLMVASIVKLKNKNNK